MPPILLSERIFNFSNAAQSPAAARFCAFRPGRDPVSWTRRQSQKADNEAQMIDSAGFYRVAQALP
jgi:hypothetical protein